MLLKAIMHCIAFLWMGLFGLTTALVLEIVAAEHSIKGFLGGALFLTTLFWFLDFFLVRILRKHYGMVNYTHYSSDYPKWKKIIHYSTYGKYDKYYE